MAPGAPPAECCLYPFCSANIHHSHFHSTAFFQQAEEFPERGIYTHLCSNFPARLRPRLPGDMSHFLLSALAALPRHPCLGEGRAVPCSAQSCSLRAAVCLCPTWGWMWDCTQPGLLQHYELSHTGGCSGYRSGSCTVVRWRCFDAQGEGEARERTENLAQPVCLPWLCWKQLLGACLTLHGLSQLTLSSPYELKASREHKVCVQ